LSQAEIDQLIKDAELHTEDDRRKKDLIDARNAADALIYATEKSIQELGDKINSTTGTEVQQAISDLKQAMEGEDVSEIKRRTETLTHASHRLAESAYQQSGPAEGQHGNQGPNPGTQPGSTNSGDDVVDAEFEEVA
jgi:molecular chaperone DnaK